MLGHVDDGSIVWLAPSKRRMWTKSGDAYAAWYGDNGWRDEIQTVPMKVEFGETDVIPYALSAREVLRRA